MIQITLDASVSGKLNDLGQPVELCDPLGRVLGRFVPVLDPSRFEPLEPQVSKEELLRRSQSDEKTYTTAEVLAYLEKL